MHRFALPCESSIVLECTCERTVGEVGLERRVHQLRMGIAILVKSLRSCVEVVFNSSSFFSWSVIMASLALTVILARVGLEDPDAQAALAKGDFEAWTESVAVDLSPVRRDMELFFTVVQSRAGEFYVKQSLRLQSATGSFGVLTNLCRPCRLLQHHRLPQ